MTKRNSNRLVYFNGDFVPENEAKISIYDSALMFGDMVFEMTRSFNQSHFLLKEHIDRLFASADFVKINIGDPGSEAKKENWKGYVDLSVGNLIIMYSKIDIRDETFEILEITTPQMIDYTSGEEVIELLM